MKDIKNQTVQVGDTVAYVRDATKRPTLDIGKITRISANDRRCKVDGHPNVFPNRILKLPEVNA